MKEFGIFISYSREDDTEFINGKKSQSPISQILERFEKADIRPWIDREGKYVGENYLKEIVNGINNSETMLFVSSKNSNASYYALLEVRKAAEKKMKVFLLLLDDTPLNEDIDLLFSTIDKRWLYPNTSKTLDELTESIKKYIEKIAQKEREKAEAEEAERRRIEEEQERKRIDEEKKKIKARLEKDIEIIKKRIINYVNKQQICMKELLDREKELNKYSDVAKECPICQNAIIDLEADYCEICGWHFAMPKELVPTEMQQMYEDRLQNSQVIWKEKRQREEEIERLRMELDDCRNSYNTILEDNKTQIQSKSDEILKLQKKLNDTKEQLAESQNKVTELSKIKSEKNVYKNPNTKQPIAFLLVTEYDQMNVYCLYEGRNQFGAMEANQNQSGYQMLVVSDNNLNPLHFEIFVRRENKRFLFSVSPVNKTCVLALNSRSNPIKSENSIQINDMLFIGDVKLQIIDNFKKTI